MVALSIITATSVACQRRPALKRFADYLKAEKELRQRITDDHALADSLADLGRRMSINYEKSIDNLLDGDPLRWNDLFVLIND